MFKQLPPQFLPGFDRHSVNRSNNVSSVELRQRSRSVRWRLTDNRPQPRNAGYEQNPIKNNCKKKIGNGSGSYDRTTTPHRLPVKRPMTLGGINLTLPFIEHLDEPAKRKCSDHPFGAVTSKSPVHQRGAEPDGEPQNLDAGRSGNDVVPELMEDDQDAERQHKSAQG